MHVRLLVNMLLAKLTIIWSKASFRSPRMATVYVRCMGHRAKAFSLLLLTRPPLLPHPQWTPCYDLCPMLYLPLLLATMQRALLTGLKLSTMLTALPI